MCQLVTAVWAALIDVGDAETIDFALIPMGAVGKVAVAGAVVLAGRPAYAAARIRDGRGGPVRRPKIPGAEHTEAGAEGATIGVAGSTNSSTIGVGLSCFGGVPALAGSPRPRTRKGRIACLPILARVDLVHMGVPYAGRHFRGTPIVIG